jgi:hypothetical protein
VRRFAQLNWAPSRSSRESQLVCWDKAIEEILDRLDGQEVGREIAVSSRLVEPLVQLTRKADRRCDSVFVVNLRSCHAGDSTEQKPASGGWFLSLLRANRALTAQTCAR